MVELGSAALDLAFYALADGTRRDIVKRLCKGHLRIVDLAQEYDSSLMNISKHVRILKTAKLVQCKKEGRATWCSIDKQGFNKITTVMRFYERFWSYQLSHLKQVAEQTEKKEKHK